jgi:hypothetical protein
MDTKTLGYFTLLGFKCRMLVALLLMGGDHSFSITDARAWEIAIA